MKIKTYTTACQMLGIPDCPFKVTSGSPEEAFEKIWKHSNAPVHVDVHKEGIKMMGMQEEGVAGELKMMDTFRELMEKGEYETHKVADEK